MNYTEPHEPAAPGRRIEQEIEVPGTISEVWAAIATGPGISSWFVPTTVEERTGGEADMDFGQGLGVEPTDVEVWEPPRRVVFRSRGERALAYEWLIEPTGGDACVVKLVNSGFGAGDDWDAELSAMSQGWRIFLQSLCLHLTHFRGRHAQPSIPTLMMPGSRADAWATLCEAMEIPPEARPGTEIETGPTSPRLVATVDTTWETSAAHVYLLLVSDPAPGTGFIAVEGDGEQVAASVYLYLYDQPDSAGELLTARWLKWMETRFLTFEQRNSP